MRTRNQGRRCTVETSEHTPPEACNPGGRSVPEMSYHEQRLIFTHCAPHRITATQTYSHRLLESSAHIAARARSLLVVSIHHRGQGATPPPLAHAPAFPEPCSSTAANSSNRAAFFRLQRSFSPATGSQRINKSRPRAPVHYGSPNASLSKVSYCTP